MGARKGNAAGASGESAMRSLPGALSREVAMSVLETAASATPIHDTPPPPVEFRYAQSEGFPALLKQLRASLLVTTYQANKLLVVRAAGAGLSTLVRTFDQPMGLAVDARRLTLATSNAVWTLRNAPDIAPRIDPPGQHDGCVLPRYCHSTGHSG